MSEEYIRSKEMAQRWNVTPRRINQLCSQGIIQGAYKSGKFWMIPADTVKPYIIKKKPAGMVRENAGPDGLLPCPVGITSYKEVATECYYVDKTLIIKDLIDDHSKVYLFTRPRRFGKTLTMDMLRTFFEESEEDTSVYFTERKIWAAGDKYRDRQGKYPVIFLSFKDAHQTGWTEMYQSLCFSIRKEFLRHIELLSGDALNEYDKVFYRSVVDSSAGPTDIQFSLGKLCDMLSAHYDQKVVVMIDEYDTPVQQGYLYGYYNEVVGFMRNLFSSVLKDNENLECGVLTGILRIAKESLFSGLNNITVNTILDEKYSEYFGFTQSDVARMASYYGMKSRLPEIKSWYDGYQFGNTEIYNPWSVVSCISNNGTPGAYWSRTSGNDVIRRMIQRATPEVFDSLESLLQGGETRAVIDTDIIYPELDGDPDMIYSFLLVAGYLRTLEVISTIGGDPICRLSIPNNEIQSVFRKEILSEYRSFMDSPLIRSFEQALRTGDEDLFTDTLERYLTQSAGSFDTARENFYHGTVFGMLAIMADRYYITSNRESGDGRFDIQLEPKDKTQTGYIIEFKWSEDPAEEAPDKLAMAAIE